MIDYKRALIILVRNAMKRRIVKDEGEIIGWATNEDGQHYPIHAPQGNGSKSSRNEKSSSNSGGGSKIPSGGGGKMDWSDGSEKQQKWAERIKKDKIDAVGGHFDEISHLPQMEKQAKTQAEKEITAYTKELKEKMLGDLENKKSAVEWIDKYQNMLPSQIFKEVYAPYKTEHQEKIKEIRQKERST